MDRYGGQQTPFLFVIDFEMLHPLVLPLHSVDPGQILYAVNGKTNAPDTDIPRKPLRFKAHPVSREKYCAAFEKVQEHINRGDTFLLNLTFPSEIEINHTLQEVFYKSKAPYRLWIKDTFTVFSPETFIKTAGEKIFSYPMKGTMDASLPDAENRLLSSRKELSEHYTIVDLIRNDLSIVSEEVSVNRFRTVRRVETNKKSLLQMSSEISGRLRLPFRNKPGSILRALLPAGSISGAPKKKTVEIIKSAEGYQRGWYTGVFGIFDGQNIDSAVMIRFMEQKEGRIFYKSGGGITALSNCREEYNELIDKIYVPFS